MRLSRAPLGSVGGAPPWESLTLRLAWLLALTFSGLPSSPALGDPDSLSFLPPKTASLGQPARWRTAWGSLAGYNFDVGPDGQHLGPTARFFVNASHRITGPQGGPEISLEASAGGLNGSGVEGAFGVYFGLPWFVVGNEYADPSLRGNCFAMSLRVPLRRGGLFGRSDLIRVDYHPVRREILGGFSFRFPAHAYRASRPRQTGVAGPRGGPPVTSVPRPPTLLPPDCERALAEVGHAIEWIDRARTPRLDASWFERDAGLLREHIRSPGHGCLDEETRYHREMDAAFTSAAGDDPTRGRVVAALAESVLFRDVLAPFDGTFGQEKTTRHAGAYCSIALGRFDACLGRVLAASPDTLAAPRCHEVFRRVLAEVQKVSARSGERWKNAFLLWSNRGAMAWVPLQYGLRPWQYDTQDEWDSVLAEVTGEPFSRADSMRYLMMEQFHLELKRMIRETRDYQVTIVHDFRGRTASGTADLYGWDLVSDGYLAAFTRAIQDLDRGERTRLPQFFLFLDANYYDANHSRAIVTYLENLYDPSRTIGTPWEVELQVRDAHEALARAIRSSPSLRGLSRSKLREAFKVHVSITNPFDPAFMLDVSRRDHRKIAFHDATELDPSSGSALITGQGIGEHYNGSGWEDRSLYLRGCALVQLKAAARRLMLQQGFKEREIPDVLRPLAYPADYEERCATLRAHGWTTPADILLNETGYGPKEATVLKAAIFDLAPPGSVLLSYDSLWISDFWAGMFLSAALRGANVLPVGPVPLNAPSAASSTLFFMRDNLRRLLEAQRYFEEDIASEGGQLRVGLYAHAVQTLDLSRRVDAFQKGYEGHPFLRDLLHLHPALFESVGVFRAAFDTVSLMGLKLRPRPFLHMKSLFFASAEAFEVYRLAEWAPTTKEHLRNRVAQSMGMRMPYPDPFKHPQGRRSVFGALDARLDSLGPDVRRRVILTFATGSHNQNPRSLLLDGEVLAAISGYDCLYSMIDIGFILCISEWPRDTAEFDRLFSKRSPPFYLRPFLRVLEDQS